MDFKKLFPFLPFGKKEEEKEYFFALNIGQQTLSAALWELSGKHLQVLQTVTSEYSSLDEIAKITDRLLDSVLGTLEVEPQKILFGVLDSWLSEDDLKEEYLKLLRTIVKELELTPMAYVATSHALLHFLENKEGVPTTAILVGFEKEHLLVTVSRAGKMDGSKLIKRSDDPGLDIEKALLTFTNVETLPSKILIYNGGDKLNKLRADLLAFSWMSKLSFLHFPKIDILDGDVQIKSICLAGGKELREDAVLSETEIVAPISKQILETPEEPAAEDKQGKESTELSKEEPISKDLGFVVGDISQNQDIQEEPEQTELAVVESNVEEPEKPIETEDFEQEVREEVSMEKPRFVVPFVGKLAFLRKFIPRVSFKSMPVWIALIVLAIIAGGYILLPRANVKIFVEPQVLEKDTQVTADPNVKTVDENAKIIPGQIIEVAISGSGKGQASGKKDIGDPAKGTIKVINNSSDSQTFSKGATISFNNIKFTLDSTVNIASTSAVADSKSTGTVNVTAVDVGADGNLPSGTQFTGLSQQVAIVSEGNFSGGTSKSVTVVSSDDQQKLLAQVAGDLRKQAQQKLQDKYPDKKILEEALSENITKKSFSKNINDQATDFSLDLTINYTGTAFDDKDLKQIVGKLVTTQIPDGFELNLAETETQADVSKLEKDGKLIFLARFKAKLMPKLDLEQIKKEITGKTPNKVAELLKAHDHILGSEIKITPTLPSILERLPFLGKNINIEVGLK